MLGRSREVSNPLVCYCRVRLLRTITGTVYGRILQRLLTYVYIIYSQPVASLKQRAQTEQFHSISEFIMSLMILIWTIARYILMITNLCHCRDARWKCDTNWIANSLTTLIYYFTEYLRLFHKECCKVLHNWSSGYVWKGSLCAMHATVRKHIRVHFHRPVWILPYQESLKLIQETLYHIRYICWICW